MTKSRLLLAAALFGLTSFFATSAFSQAGKIEGTVTSAEDSAPLPGINVVIKGTTQGAASNAEGYYSILNVAPGEYTLRASGIGFTAQVVKNVQVNIDQTTKINFELPSGTVGMEEVVVSSEEPIVQKDVSANVANLNSEDLENVPVASVGQAVELQAGVGPGLSVRGSDRSEVSFQVDGFSTRNGRNNQPFTGIPYTAINAVKVQTGGFNAEYGNVRSGLVTVSLKEGPRDHYMVDVLSRYSPASHDYFGMSPGNSNAYFQRPYLDDPNISNDKDPAFVGTSNGAWDKYTRRQYPDFKGWNAVAQNLAQDDNPNNDLSPQQLIDVYKFRSRKSFAVQPKFVVDGTIGGPVPGISEALGDLRFIAAYRQDQNPYIIPQVRDSYTERTGQVKLTSNLMENMKLDLQGLYAKQEGVNAIQFRDDAPVQRDRTTIFRGSPKYPWDTRDELMSTKFLHKDDLFANDRFSAQDITRNIIGAKLTHSLGPNTFYEVNVQRNYSDYFTRPGPTRSNKTVKTIGKYKLDEAPLGFKEGGANGFSGLRLGGHWATTRDSSDVTVWMADVDFTSQIGEHNQVKAGLSANMSDYNINYAQWDPYFRNIGIYKWNRDPVQGAAYLQDKIEFESLVANVGLRLDYFNPRGKWFDYGPFTRAFTGESGAENLDKNLKESSIDAQWALSPRLGISFPITDNSKFFLNYGHFRQLLEPGDIFNVRESSVSSVNLIGNPSHPMPKTVAYELGYEQNIFNQFLLRLTGFYKALEDQPRLVQYTSVDNAVNYSKSIPNNYEDIRGFEITMRKNTGKYIRGFANFTYQSIKEGNFGFAEQFENQFEQRQFERESKAHYQNRPVPQPFARVNLRFLAPSDFGPDAGGLHPLGNWTLSLLGEWRAGETFTWSGFGSGEVAELQNNVSWKDYYNLDLRLSKNFSTSLGQMQIFADASNVLNLKHLHRGSPFEGPNDFENYMQSLHLSGDIFNDLESAPYEYIHGDDEPGDFRDPNADFVPVEVSNKLPEKGMRRTQGRYGPLYYAKNEGEYYVWNGNSFKKADGDKVDQVLDDKAYIDMPNQQYFRFLNPRNILFGVRITI